MHASQHDVLIALGANLGNRQRTLSLAIAQLGRWVDDIRLSDVYATAPRYIEDQPEFLNMAVSGRTALAPHELLAVVQQVETALGRVRTQRYGPRTIDVDIIYYGDWRVRTPTLTVPHPLRAERRFVLAPLADVAPGFVDPETGLTVGAMLAALPPGDGCVSLGRLSPL